MEFGDVLGLSGADGVPKFWLGRQTNGGSQPEVHLGFKAPDQAAVDTVHRAVRGAGAEVLHEPKEWPEYHPGYYAVFLRDPDGNNVEVVSHSCLGGRDGAAGGRGEKWGGWVAVGFSSTAWGRRGLGRMSRGTGTWSRRWGRRSSRFSGAV